MALWVTKFLKRALPHNKLWTVVITCKRDNRGAGYGVELPCQYTDVLQGENFLCNYVPNGQIKEREI